MLMSRVVCFFFFKQKTAYEMRISDWSSDVCSSDLRLCAGAAAAGLFRADQLAQDGAARARSRQRSSIPSPSRSLRFVRLEEIRLRGTDRRGHSGLLLRLALHRADRTPCRLHWIMVGRAARG